MKNFVLFAFLLVLTAGVSASAKVSMSERVAAQVSDPALKQKCAMQEGDTFVSVTFSMIEEDISLINTVVGKKQAEIEKIAADAGIIEMELQSMNYSVTANATSRLNSMQVHGSFNFKLEHAAEAATLTTKLAAAGFGANMNHSSYRQCQ